MKQKIAITISITVSLEMAQLIADALAIVSPERDDADEEITLENERDALEVRIRKQIEENSK